MHKLISVFITVLIIQGISLAQNYRLVWSDEFNDTALNDFFWKYELGNNNGWGNNELEYYTNNPKNITLSDGKLIITALRENFGGFFYTSARILTRLSWKYGKIEARIKMPHGQGIWPAFWMLGANINTVGWPACGEIDIVEMIGGVSGDNTAYGTAHWSSNGKQSKGGSYKLPNAKLSDDFHVYRIEWDSQKIIWYLDDVLYYLLPFTPSMSAFQAPFFIILNLAVGGNWGGYPDATTVFPQTMIVDYVRVSELTTGVGSVTQTPNNYSLSQNYPNPFNPSTVIRYSIAEAGVVKLKISDLLGREVVELVDKYQEPGNHQINFEASGLAPGVYFYTLSSGKFSESKKLILLK